MSKIDIACYKGHNTWYIMIPDSAMQYFIVAIREGRYVFKRINPEIITWLNENTPNYEADDSANEILFEFDEETDAMAFKLAWC